MTQQLDLQRSRAQERTLHEITVVLSLRARANSECYFDHECKATNRKKREEKYKWIFFSFIELYSLLISHLTGLDSETVCTLILSPFW